MTKLSFPFTEEEIRPLKLDGEVVRLGFNVEFLPGLPEVFIGVRLVS